MTLPPTRPSRSAGRPTRSTEAGIGRPGGLLVAAVTAALVFALGHQLWPRHAAEATPPAPTPPPTPAPPPATPPAPAAAPTVSDAALAGVGDGPSAKIAGEATPPIAPNAVDAAPADARRILPEAAAPAAPRATAEATKTDKLATATEPAPTSAADAAQPAPARRAPEGDKEERPADKDLARQAWRSNRPDVSVDGGKSSILIPLKGSIAGAAFHVTNKPHAVIVTLPKAASLITMRVYRVNRNGFRLLWINQAEKDADPKDGTSFKLGLTDWGDPLVEIKDDFVRVTVHRQAGAPGTDGAAKPAPAHDSVPAPKAGAAHDDAPVPADNHAD